jgi:surface antigen
MTFNEWWSSNSWRYEAGEWHGGEVLAGEAYRAGQEEMRERAAGVAREGQSLHIWAWIRDLPLEGDE